MKKADFYVLAGVFFVFLQAVAITRNLYFDFVYFFWLCDFVPIVLAIAFFVKKDEVIKGVLNIGLFPQLFYIGSFILRVGFGISILGDIEEIMDYNAFVIVSSVLLHLATVVALGFTYKVRPHRKALGYSLFGLVLIYLVVGIFTTPADSINYVFFVSNFFEVEALSIFWIPLTFFVVIVPTYWFQVLVWRWTRKE